MGIDSSTLAKENRRRGGEGVDDVPNASLARRVVVWRIVCAGAFDCLHLNKAGITVTYLSQ